MGVAMIHTIQLRPDTSREAAQAVLDRTQAEDVALAFPSGERCTLAREGELEALYQHCQALSKRVVIIGGDEMLRAYAVAAGFAAATSVEEWETAKHRAVRPPARTWKLGVRLTGAPAPRPPELQLVPGRDEPARDSADLYDVIGEDPPHYLAALVAHDGALSSPGRHASVPTIPLARARTTRRLSETVRDQREAEALERAHQEYEEKLTEAIRSSAAGPTPAESVREVPEPTADANANM
jgi:hypothetical protein